MGGKDSLHVTVEENSLQEVHAHVGQSLSETFLQLTASEVEHLRLNNSEVNGGKLAASLATGAPEERLSTAQGSNPRMVFVQD